MTTVVHAKLIIWPNQEMPLMTVSKAIFKVQLLLASKKEVFVKGNKN